MLQLVVPALFQTAEYIETPGDAGMPHLERLLVRGRRTSLEHLATEELLCRELGIERQQDWPIASMILASAGRNPGNAYWLRADPVHVRIERDQLILHQTEPTEEEADLLCNALASHFGNEFSPQPLRPDAWFVSLPHTPQLATTPLSLAAGRHIEPLLPLGGDAMKWRKLLNEVQMLLFHHPVNQVREQRGEPAINSVWVWGGGCLPAGHDVRRMVLCGNPDLRAIAEFAGAQLSPLPKNWNPQMPDDALVIVDEPHGRLRNGDFSAWLQKMQELDRYWLQPLMASGRAFRIDDPLRGSTLWWRRVDGWKFWKRSQKRVQKAFTLQAPVDSGVDAFGNRYE